MHLWLRLSLSLLLLLFFLPRPAAAQRMFEITPRADAADSAGHYAEAAGLWKELYGMSGGNPRLLYLAGRSFARAGERDSAFATLRRAVGAGLVLDRPLEADSLLHGLHADPRWPALLDRARRKAAARDEALRAELLALAERDQLYRVQMDSVVRRFGTASPQFDSLRTAMAASDAPLQARLREIVQARGLPTRSLVGDDGASAAWLILQHADSAYQHRLLPAALAAAHAGELGAGEVALLQDRVLTNQGLPQRYGSQVVSAGSGSPEPHPIEDEACVDRRRAAVLLPPLADYLALFGIRYAPPPEPCRP